MSAAKEWLAPLPVLVAILATVTGTFAAVVRWPPLALLAIAGGLALTAVVGRRRYGARVSVAAGAVSLVAAFFVFYLWAAGFGPYLFSSVCGKHVDSAWVWAPFTGGALSFGAAGSWGLRTYRLWAVALAVVLAGVVILLLVAAVPGTPGVCET